MKYNWQQRDWPEFRYNLHGLEASLLSYSSNSGRVGGLLDGLPEDLGIEAVLSLMMDEAITSFAIEGETLEREAVMSSIRNHLGLNPTLEKVKSRKADGAGELMVAVRRSFSEPLSEEMIFAWHQMLLGGTRGLLVGAWRTNEDPMQVVSGALHKPVVHFEAPPSRRVPEEMARFIRWFNETAPGQPNQIIHAPVRSGIAHLYFESIHPFEDGNGRIGRAISEKALAQGLGRPAVLSLSKTIEASRSKYYDALKASQNSNEITGWLEYFSSTVLQAQLDAESQVSFILRKSKFFQKFETTLNERQLKVIRKVLSAGPGGFEGGLNARKYIALTGASKATATRDLQELANSGVIISIGAGRSTRYAINLE